MSRNNILRLKNIRQTNADIYGNGRQYVEFPCRVITSNEEQIDIAIISFQKNAPFEENRNYRLASDIEEIMASPYALPYDIRRASTEAEELRMGFSPIVIEVENQKFTLNGTTNFFVKRGLTTKNAIVSEKKISLHDLPSIVSEPANVIYFAADPIVWQNY